jgi:uncharacterized protein (TIGR02145 family)
MNSILSLFTLILMAHLQLSSQDVKVGKQIWMSKNLDVTKFRNGQLIPQAKNQKEWEYASQNKIPAWCYYEFDEKNGKLYGMLYNWYAVNYEGGLAPQGYHIPSYDEWIELQDYFGGRNTAEVKKMKSVASWKSYELPGEDIPCSNCKSWNYEYRKKVPCNVCFDNRTTGKTKSKNVSGNGDNTSGFNALPGGKIYNGNFNSLGESGYWWTSTEYRTGFSFYRALHHNKSTEIDGYFSENYNGLSVRCVKD